MINFLNKVGITNDDGKMSITNVVVYVFLFIVSFRTLFSGAVLSVHDLTWKVSDLDISATLPLLFSLINYRAKGISLTNGQKDANNAK